MSGQEPPRELESVEPLMEILEWRVFEPETKNLERNPGRFSCCLLLENRSTDQVNDSLAISKELMSLVNLKSLVSKPVQVKGRSRIHLQ